MTTIATDSPTRGKNDTDYFTREHFWTKYIFAKNIFEKKIDGILKLNTASVWQKLYMWFGFANKRSRVQGARFSADF